MVFKTQELIALIVNKSLKLVIQWIPSHCKITGNEIADQAAKLGLSNEEIEPCPLAASTLKRLTLQAATQKWRENNLTLTTTKHLGQIRRDLQPHPWARSSNRRLDTAIVRLRIGHCGLKAHLHRINLEDKDNCDWLRDTDRRRGRMGQLTPLFIFS